MTILNEPETQSVYSMVTVPEHFQGYPGVVHGGIVAAMLDEVSGRVVLMGGNNDALLVTAKLEVRYRRPTPTLTPLKVIGRFLSQAGRLVKAAGEIRLPDGTVTAECVTWLAPPPDDVRTGWEAELPYWKVDPDQ